MRGENGEEMSEFIDSFILPHKKKNNPSRRRRRRWKKKEKRKGRRAKGLMAIANV